MVGEECKCAESDNIKWDSAAQSCVCEDGRIARLVQDVDQSASLECSGLVDTEKNSYVSVEECKTAKKGVDFSKTFCVKKNDLTCPEINGNGYCQCGSDKVVDVSRSKCVSAEECPERSKNTDGVCECIANAEYSTKTGACECKSAEGYTLTSDGKCELCKNFISAQGGEVACAESCPPHWFYVQDNGVKTCVRECLDGDCKCSGRWMKSADGKTCECDADRGYVEGVSGCKCPEGYLESGEGTSPKRCISQEYCAELEMVLDADLKQCVTKEACGASENKALGFDN